MLFAVWTINIPKTQAIQNVLKTCPYTRNENVEIRGFKVSSEVSDMPLTLAELRDGARNRARNTRVLCAEADFFIWMEWWVYKDSVGDEYWLIGVVYIENTNWEGHFGYSCHMWVPDVVMRWLLDGTGEDLEQIMESLWCPKNIWDNQGSYAAWSDDMLTRTDQFRLATQCAIVPFFNAFYSL